jgi:hypothetical protein
MEVLEVIPKDVNNKQHSACNHKCDGKCVGSSRQLLTTNLLGKITVLEAITQGIGTE